MIKIKQGRVFKKARTWFKKIKDVIKKKQGRDLKKTRTPKSTSSMVFCHKINMQTLHQQYTLIVNTSQHHHQLCNVDIRLLYTVMVCRGAVAEVAREPSCGWQLLQRVLIGQGCCWNRYHRVRIVFMCRTNALASVVSFVCGDTDIMQCDYTYVRHIWCTIASWHWKIQCQHWKSLINSRRMQVFCKWGYNVSSVVSVITICKYMYSNISENQLSILGGCKCSANAVTTFRAYIYTNKNRKQHIGNNSPVLWIYKCYANDINILWFNWTCIWESFCNLRRMQVFCKCEFDVCQSMAK